MTGADLREAELVGADLREASLDGADLRGADLTGADLRRAGLTGADLREAQLTAALLGEADLTGADLREASLGWADLAGTDLRTEGWAVAWEQIAQARLYRDTLLPGSIVVPPQFRAALDALGPGETFCPADVAENASPGESPEPA